jgi:hypothetical protein
MRRRQVALAGFTHHQRLRAFKTTEGDDDMRPTFLRGLRGLYAPWTSLYPESDLMTNHVAIIVPSLTAGYMYMPYMPTLHRGQSLSRETASRARLASVCPVLRDVGSIYIGQVRMHLARSDGSGWPGVCACRRGVPQGRDGVGHDDREWLSNHQRCSPRRDPRDDWSSALRKDAVD